MNDKETLGVEEAAALLHAETGTVMHYARRGLLPGTRIGKAWVFLREDVIAFLRAQIASDTEQRRMHAANATVAVSLPRPLGNRRKPLPVLPPLPTPGPTGKRSP